MIEGPWAAALTVLAVLILLMVLSGLADAVARRICNRRAWKQVKGDWDKVAEAQARMTRTIAAAKQVDLNAGVDISCFIVKPQWIFSGRETDDDGQEFYVWHMTDKRMCDPEEYRVTVKEFWGTTQTP